MSESVSGVNDKYAVNGKQCDDMEERKEIFDNTDGDEQDEVCNNSNTNSSNSDSEGAAVTFHAENVNGSIFLEMWICHRRDMIQPQACLSHLMCHRLDWNPKRGLHLHLQVNNLRVKG